MKMLSTTVEIEMGRSRKDPTSPAQRKLTISPLSLSGHPIQI